jgi:broad specificity phosphatase PhoE
MNERRPAKNGEPPFKMLYFIRHGQYRVDDSADTGRLTPLGRKQALLLGRHLRLYPIDSVVSSDLPRAVETAQLVAQALGIPRFRRRRLLREMVPSRVNGLKVPLVKRADGKQRLQSIIDEYFTVTRKTRHELVICHGNLIRALVCRLARAPITSFTRMRVHHTGITCFMVNYKSIYLISYNGVHHLTGSQQSH